MGDLNIPIYLHGFTPDKTDPRLGQAAVKPWQAGEKRHYVIQFTHSLLKEEREAVQQQYGLVLEAYIPEFAYIEYVGEQTVAQLSQRDDLVNALFPLTADYKVSPGIGKATFKSKSRQDMSGQLLRAVLFPEANLTELEGQLQQLGATDIHDFDDRERGGVARIEFRLQIPAHVAKIAELETVSWIEEIPETVADGPIPIDILESGTFNVTPFADKGLRGKDQVIAVIDTGPLNLGHCWFRAPTGANNTPNPAHRKVLAAFDSGSGNAVHPAFVCGILAGDDVDNPGTPPRGIASDAKITFGNREDFKGPGDGLNLRHYLERVALDDAQVNLRAHIVNASWHSAGNPQYSQDAVDADDFTWTFENCLIVASTGNTGEGNQGPPGTAKNSLCVGAAYVNPNVNPAVSCLGDGIPGPTGGQYEVEDRRRKPDLLAPGCEIDSADTSNPNQCGTQAETSLGFVNPGAADCKPPGTFCASSFATPVVSAAAAIVRQYFAEGRYPSGKRLTVNKREPSAALLKAALLTATEKTTHGASYPSDAEGWGLLQLDRILRLPQGTRKIRIWDVRNANGLFTGQSTTRTVTVKNDNNPLKVTLVWTDPPGQLHTSKPSVNNLDLVVTAPGGAQTYLGNVFVNNYSDPGGVPDQRQPDTRNNVEMVLVNQPTPGPWRITVKATQVSVGPTGQGYALVVRGNLT